MTIATEMSNLRAAWGLRGSVKMRPNNPACHYLIAKHHLIC